MKSQLRQLINWKDIDQTLEIEVKETDYDINVSFIIDITNRYKISIYFCFDAVMALRFAYQDNWSWLSLTVTIQDDKGDEQFVEVRRYKFKKMAFYGDWHWFRTWLKRYTISMYGMEEVFLCHVFIPIIVERHLNHHILMKKYIDLAGV